MEIAHAHSTFSQPKLTQTWQSSGALSSHPHPAALWTHRHGFSFLIHSCWKPQLLTVGANVEITHFSAPKMRVKYLRFLEQTGQPLPLISAWGLLLIMCQVTSTQQPIWGLSTTLWNPQTPTERSEHPEHFGEHIMNKLMEMR